MGNHTTHLHSVRSPLRLDVSCAMAHALAHLQLLEQRHRYRRRHVYIDLYVRPSVLKKPLSEAKCGTGRSSSATAASSNSKQLQRGGKAQGRRRKLLELRRRLAMEEGTKRRRRKAPAHLHGHGIMPHQHEKPTWRGMDLSDTAYKVYGPKNHFES